MNTGFIGAGSMASALLAGAVKKGILVPGQTLVSNRSNRQRLEELRRELGVRPASPQEVVRSCGAVILATKPKDVAAVLTATGKEFRPGQVLISVAAGITTKYIRERLPEGVEVIRAMPNTPVTVGYGATALSAGEGVTPKAVEMAVSLFGAVGRVWVLPEGALDAVTGLSGSGPAYVFLFLEALTEAGREAGLPGKTAAEMALQTLLGAAVMASETGTPPAELRRAVTSPGGTTEAGLAVFDRSGFREIMKKVVSAATRRAGELSSG